MNFSKKMTALSLLLLLISQPSFATDNPFHGTWQLISGEYLDNNLKLIKYSELGISSRKVLTDSHFSFVSTKNNDFWAAGFGTYRYDQQDYTETPSLASYPLEHGGSYQFRYRLEGNLWYNERWRNNTRVEYEVWQRIE